MLFCPRLPGNRLLGVENNRFERCFDSLFVCRKSFQEVKATPTFLQFCQCFPQFGFLGEPIFDPSPIRLRQFVVEVLDQERFVGGEVRLC